MKSSQKWELLRNPGLGMATSKIPILKWKMKMCVPEEEDIENEISDGKSDFPGPEQGSIVRLDIPPERTADDDNELVTPVERTISQQGEIFSEMGTAKKSRSWHGNLKDTDPEVENEN
ncbi:hypothetical protein QYM36_005956, partial [Artemia franciscana]